MEGKIVEMATFLCELHVTLLRDVIGRECLERKKRRKPAALLNDIPMLTSPLSSISLLLRPSISYSHPIGVYTILVGGFGCKLLKLYRLLSPLK